MKTLLAVTAALALAACASEEPNAQYAKAECKATPITTDSVGGNAPKHMSKLEQDAAQADLATSGYRFQQLRRQGLVQNNVEDTLKNCD